VIGDAGVLADPGDIREIADALDEILGNRSFAWTLAERARARAATFPTSMTGALAAMF
jgi:glycosyltransferase involved in cell wall biosynthesis